MFPRNPLVTDKCFESISKIRTSISKRISAFNSSVLDEFNDTHEAIVRKFEHQVRKFEHQFRKQFHHRIRRQIPSSGTPMKPYFENSNIEFENSDTKFENSNVNFETNCTIVFVSKFPAHRVP